MEKQTGGYRHYHAYLLRLWQETEHSTWRICLQTTNTNEKHLFSDLDDLLHFLDQVLADDQEPPAN